MCANDGGDDKLKSDAAVAIDNAQLVVLGDREGREVYKATAPVAASKVSDLVLIASEELFYDETRTHYLTEWENKAGSICRGYKLHNGDIFSATAEAFNEAPAVGKFVGFAADDTAWQKNKKEILALLEQGKNVGFLTIGDPMFYSTYIYVFRLLQQEKVEIETIPGIPAFCAIGSATNTPIVEGDSILSIIPANMPEERVKAALKTCDNAVLMKVYKNSDEVIDMLAAEGLAKQAVLASRCGLDDEVIIRDISQEKGRKLNYLSTILTRR